MNYWTSLFILLSMNNVDSSHLLSKNHQMQSNLIIKDEKLINPIVIAGDFFHVFQAELNKTTDYIFEFIYDTQDMKVSAK